eukprot:CAMPEP_0182564116 /NCGR_PEP_ID=MMETSP1324-20130603/6122_1 /TAXON_ID=236786 /ORGANISM="Florenciella sp., Strain RCC1587" /LENGTH=38 /DNA_ID= /DNA_START= /DNA_END= /DNA_ORIENTATION=
MTTMTMTMTMTAHLHTPCMTRRASRYGTDGGDGADSLC